MADVEGRATKFCHWLFGPSGSCGIPTPSRAASEPVQSQACCEVGGLIAQLSNSSGRCTERLDAAEALIIEVEAELIRTRVPIDIQMPCGVRGGYITWCAGNWYPKSSGHFPIPSTGSHDREYYIDGSLRYGPNASYGTESLRYANPKLKILAAAKLRSLLSQAISETHTFALAGGSIKPLEDKPDASL